MRDKQSTTPEALGFGASGIYLAARLGGFLGPESYIGTFLIAGAILFAVPLATRRIVTGSFFPSNTSKTELKITGKIYSDELNQEKINAMLPRSTFLAGNSDLNQPTGSASDKNSVKQKLNQFRKK